MTTLKHVRFYEKSFHPSDFTGLLGLVIRVLNVLRYKLELLVQRLVLKYEVRKQVQPGLRSHVERGLAEKFWLDDQKERMSLRERDINVELSMEPTVEVSLETGDPVPTRARSMESMISRYGVEGRAKRYSLRSSQFIFEDFETVPEETPETPLLESQ